MSLWTDREIKFLEDNYTILSYPEIAKLLNRSVASIRHKAARMQLRRGYRTYSVNEDFFDTWSQEMSHILGLWFADGCIKRQGNQRVVEISLNQKDRSYLQQIKELIGYSGPLREQRDGTLRLTITSRKMYESVLRLGGMERKSLVVHFPTIPDEFIREFVHGFFNGDGGVQVARNGDGYLYLKVYFIGGLNFITILQNVISKYINIDGRLYNKDKQNRLFELRYTCKYAEKLLEWLYTNPSIIMYRKYSIFLNYCRRKE